MSEAEKEAALLAVRSNDKLGLLPKIEAHIRQLSPHMMQRDGVVLLREAKDEIESLRLASERLQKILYLSTRDIITMTTEEKTTWTRLVRGGWWTGDLEALLDGMKMPNNGDNSAALAPSAPKGES